ncbi:DoxX family protein [Zeaxanthinibacter enoshimensis]|uniref:Putative oxidoreductase n=1 Tax=Zeaxanthinibacter enoshimensis TaxID=392009 RepID=A0A4R6TPL4_9FLAO|nr:DoxX family protein [Zeaxanthinibacter enoshimensis]TDQ31311.1 putative oxidoreductase [Zeaxanthinibacter enoshimensis]
MNKSLKTDLGLALLRIVPSALMLTHGIGKFTRLINGNFEFADPIGIGQSPSLFLAVIGEFICPVLVILGYKTRWVAVPPAITMLVAAFVVHANDPIAKKEMALLYMVFFVVIILLGPGRYSIDKK